MLLEYSKNQAKKYILQLIFDGKMEMVTLLFKGMMLTIRVSVIVIEKKRKINTKSFTKVELIGADNAMPQIL